MKKIIVFLVLVVLFSCNQKEEKREKSQESKTSKVEEFKSKYGVKYTITEFYDFDYSYQFNKVIESEKQLFQFYEIFDIYTKNNQNYVRLGDGKNYYDLLVEEDSIINTLINLDNSYSETTPLIIKLTEMKKMDFLVDVYKDSYEGEAGYIIELIDNYNFIGKGKVLELIKI